MRAFCHSIIVSITHLFKCLFQGKQLAAPATKAATELERNRRLTSDALSTEQVPAELKRLIYRTTYQLRTGQRVHASRIGALLKQTDATFSYEKYRFAKLIDLLRAVPELVALEKVIPEADLTNRQPAPIYYVRTVTDTTALITDCLQSFEQQSFERQSWNRTQLAGQLSETTQGWVHWQSLKEAIANKSPDFSAQRYGFDTFQDLLKTRPDLIEFKPDTSDYLRLIYQQLSPSYPANSRQLSPTNKPSPAYKQSPKTTLVRPHSRNASVTLSKTPQLRGSRPESLLQFSGLSIEVLNEKVSELAAIALPETWYFGPQPPADFAYPILKSYLRYTFIRLQHENKVLTTPQQTYRAFNTGLLDTLLRPIYALFSASDLTRSETAPKKWTLNFCIAGEDTTGKILIAEFSQLPVAANYFENADKAFYYLEAGTPTVDWQHVVKDNMARLPLPFLKQYAPAGFVPRSTQTMSTPEFYDYKRSFINALESDPSGYRNIVNRLEEALSQTLRRTQINYTTAVPTYYPKINSVDLLLPMCLVNEHTVDLALVVRREPSGKYIGHTILTLRQAYNNARLICKLDHHWLPQAMKIHQGL